MRPFVDTAQDVRPAMLRAMNPRSAAGRRVQRLAFGVAARANDRFGGLIDRFSRPPSDAIGLPDYPGGGARRVCARGAHRAGFAPVSAHSAAALRPASRSLCRCRGSGCLGSA